jgi:hypothetical protein
MKPPASATGYHVLCDLAMLYHALARLIFPGLAALGDLGRKDEITVGNDLGCCRSE